MIHTLLALTDRPLIVFDTETTGVNTMEDRIVEIGFQQWTAAGLIKEYRTLVNPLIPIPDGASRVHGILDEVFTRCAVCELIDSQCTCPSFRPHLTFKELAPNLAIGFTNCDFAGKNVRFDLRILSSEMKRAGVKWDYAGARVVDAERMEQVGEPRTLSDLYRKHTGEELVGAHGALTDVRASTTVIQHQLEAYATLPRSLDELHEKLWAGWIDSEGVFRFREDGVPFCSLGKHRGKPMRDIPENYYWWIVNKSDFPSDVKAIAAAAEKRVYPVRKAKTDD